MSSHEDCARPVAHVGDCWAAASWHGMVAGLAPKTSMRGGLVIYTVTL